MRNIFAKSSAAVVIALLSACTVQIEDKRLTRGEVAAAFKQRDDALVGLTKAVEQLIAERNAALSAKEPNK